MFDFKLFRGANKLTQVAAAEYFGCTQSFISRIERGLSPTPDSFITKIEADGLYTIPEAVQPVGGTDKIEISSEIFNKIAQLIDTVHSQQEVIKNMQSIINKAFTPPHAVTKRKNSKSNKN